MKCISLNKDGETQILNLLRKDVLRAFHLHNRDLRPILLPNQMHTILVRDDSIIVNLGRIRLIIGEEEALIFNVEVKDVAKDFIKLVKRTLTLSKKEKESIFSFIVLEIGLGHTLSLLEERYSSIENDVQSILKKLGEDISEDNLENLLKIKNRISVMETNVIELQDALLELLEDEEDLGNMYLYQKRKSIKLKNTDEIESILDHHLEQVSDIVHKIRETNTFIGSTLEITTLKINSLRNTIIKTDLLFTLITGILTFGAVVTGLFGSNLKNHFEQNSSAFFILTMGILIGSIFMFVGAYLYFRKKKIL